MTEGWRSAADVASVAATGAFFLYLAVAWSRRKRRNDGCVPDKPDQPYTIYTTEFDLALRARDLPSVLSSDPFLKWKGWVLGDLSVWQRKVANARDIVARFEKLPLPTERKDSLDDWAICFLVDQSGSMRDAPIAHVAAAMWVQVERLVNQGASVSVLGFSTVGWHGGKARQKWLFDGQPKRPGRLCALLHVIYQDFGENLEPEDWDVMLHPDILRENVDGEALIWALERVKRHASLRRALIVVSDGAPVDDATLMHNGTGYLERHLQSGIRRIEADDQIILGAVGVGFEVGRYYALSECANGLEDLPSAIDTLVARVTSQASHSSAFED